ncbi:alpha/beta hydrolase [Congregibacter variabilis]|uniref:Alpha/beta hydrolase n=1 Tax=Congregibacter variabilis TaxID=3081200 RepID=A0ABZ0I347_9GAMM|nr:alpha/beta hydrolase [Congregibacter sp. IMCC43200]
MSTQPLAPAIQADEVVWSLPGVAPVLCYYRQGEGCPLLLLHSMNAAASAFEVKPFFDDMALKQPLYAPDLPGFGRSERADRVYSPDFYAQVVVDIIKAMDCGPVDVLALSTTAEFAARAALRDSDLVRSLTLISPTGFSRRRDSRSPVGARVHRILSLPFLGAGLFRALRTKPSIRFFLDKAFGDGAPEDMVEYARNSAAQPGASYAPFYFVSGQLFTPDAVGELYLPLKLPVSVLYDEDPNISFDYLEEVARQGDNWSLVKIPGTLGLPQFEKPSLTESALKEFLKNL